jgi:AraC family transcriptional activator of pobA
MSESAVPTFYLYGEPHRSISESFVHVESLDDRSRPSEWTIRPHSHADLSHLFLISTGGGSMQAEDRRLFFNAPCLLVMPATVVHGFDWTRESSGSVVTLTGAYLKDVINRDPDICALFEKPRVIGLDGEEGKRAAACAENLVRELGWAASGHRVAIDAALFTLLVLAVRGVPLHEPDEMPPPGHQAALVARFRARVELRFRMREPVCDHAAALGVSESALRAACARVAKTPPALILDQRALLEARRALLFSNLSVAKIAYSVGFSDPGYFSRFFSRHVGTSPKGYRDMNGRDRATSGNGKPLTATVMRESGIWIPPAKLNRAF